MSLEATNLAADLDVCVCVVKTVLTHKAIIVCSQMSVVKTVVSHKAIIVCSQMYVW